MAHVNSRIGASTSRIRSVALLVGAVALLGCVDLTEPWKQGGTGGAGGASGSDSGSAGDDALASGSGAAGGAGAQDLDSGQGRAEVGAALDLGAGGVDGGGGIDGGGHLDGSGFVDAPLGGAGGVGGTSGNSDGAFNVDGGDGPSTRGSGGAGGSRADAAPKADVPGAGDVPVRFDTRPDVVDAYVPPPLPTGLVAYYPCDEVVGTSLPDVSGNEHHGTLLVAPVDAGTSGGTRLDEGKVGGALRLVQSGGGYISLPVAVFRGRSELTISTWVRLSSLTTWQRLFDTGINANLTQNQPTGTVYLTLFLQDFDHKLGLSSTSNGYENATGISANALPTRSWKHVTVVFTGGEATLYVDAASVGKATMLGPKDLGAIDYAFIGKSQFANDPLLDARIDELRVYDHALTQTEIQTVMQYGGL